MVEIICQFRSMSGEQPVCQVVADFMDRPLEQCHTNDSACAECLRCGIAPQKPNAMVASMAIGVAKRTNDLTYFRATIDRFKGFLNSVSPPITTCVLRGPEIRKVACKPCQADSLVPVMVPVFRCPKHNECTLHNTGTFPKIHACATCDDRLEKYVQIDVKPAPPEVLAAMPRRRMP